DESKNHKCPHCLSEILNEDDLERHLLSCKRKSPSPNLNYENVRSDPFSKYRGDASPDHPDSSVYGSNNQEAAPAGDYTQVLKLLRNAVPQMSNSQQLALEVILNAQMSLSRMGGAVNNDNEAFGQEQSMPLHQQQLLQLQLIQLLQAQLNVNGEKVANSEDKYSRENGERSQEESPFSVLKDRMSIHEKENDQGEVSERKSSLNAKNSEENSVKKIQSNNSESSRRSVSPLTTKGISSLVIQHPDSPPPGGPNTLEMLQKTADEVLNNASKGLLASRLIDSCREADNGDPNRRHRCRYCGKVFSSDSGLQIHIRSHTGERPFKCNICGNRFTTKGNLKVHFQRHSDQFPNIKMNPHPVPEHLDKFYPPLLPQNSDHMNENSSLPVSPPSSMAVSPITSSTPPFKPIGVRPPLNLNFKNISDSLLKPPTADIGRDIARNFLDFRLFPPFLVPPLAKPNIELPSESPKEPRREPEEKRDENEEPTSDNARSPFHCESVKVEKDDDETSSQNGLPLETEKETVASNNEDHTMDSLNILRQNFMGTNLPESKNLYRDIIDFKENSDSLDEETSHQPLNLKSTNNKSALNSSFENLREKHDDEEKKNDEQDDSYMSDSSSATNDKNSKHDNVSNGSPVEFSHLPFLGMPGPPNISLLQNLQLPFPGPPHPNAQGPPFPVPPGFDPSKVPHIYTNLLPRPGSTDNSWEALIEIKKSNENQKIEQLIDKNKEKPTEPNQCAICQRVLSCKSALQMHYRVHTGERPFKCKICCRSFTTKGNLKTHMSVHRAKPPMRMLQQCPICHKKFSNALILQQHIRLHTGEPTDLSPEQIYAAEVRDFPHDIPVPLRFPPLGPGGLPPHMQPRSPFAPLPLPLHFYGPHKPHRKEDSLEAKYGNLFNSSPRSSSTSSAEQHSAEDLSMRMRDEDGPNDPISSRSYMISPTLSDYSDLDDKSQDALKERSESQENHSKELPPLGSAEAAHYGMIGENSSHPMGLGFPHSLPGFPSLPKDAGIKPPMFPFFPPLGLLSPIKHNPNAMHNFNIQGMPPITGRLVCKVCALWRIFSQSCLSLNERYDYKTTPLVEDPHPTKKDE
ncbi:Homeotic protein spalt-major, partial [Armadillidium vulgare]